jgi:hypothetical protein
MSHCARDEPNGLCMSLNSQKAAEWKYLGASDRLQEPEFGLPKEDEGTATGSTQVATCIGIMLRYSDNLLPISLNDFISTGLLE